MDDAHQKMAMATFNVTLGLMIFAVQHLAIAEEQLNIVIVTIASITTPIKLVSGASLCYSFTLFF